MNWFWWLLAVLCCWGLIVLVRRAREDGGPDAPTHGRTESQTSGRHAAEAAGEDNEIHYDELEQAERELEDLDANLSPEDGFEGDDWGPGVPRGRKPEA